MLPKYYSQFTLAFEVWIERLSCQMFSLKLSSIRLCYENKVASDDGFKVSLKY